MRIIGGEFRGRRLKAPQGHGTRPTPDRVREALFSILAAEVPGARVAELFGGTGSLGLEALSRGAEHAVFLETARGAFACLQANVETLGVADRVTLYPRSAFSLPRLAAGGPPFDLVFCDPPHRLLDEGDSRERVVRLLSEVPLAEGGLVLLEHRAGSLPELAPPGLVQKELRTWGSTGMALFRHRP